jgi:subtilisin family serine protease
MSTRSWFQRLRGLWERLLGRRPREDHERDAVTAPTFRLAPDDEWSEVRDRLDPLLRLAVTMLERNAARQFLLRAGVDIADMAVPPFLPLHLELSKKLSDANVEAELRSLKLQVPGLYLDNAELKQELRNVSAHLAIERDRSRVAVGRLKADLLAVLKSPLLRRVSIATPLLPCRSDTPAGIGLPANRTVQAKACTGKGVIIGIIDDGCALADWNFLEPGAPRSRVLYLWDQSTDAKDPAKGWTQPADLPFGWELANVGPRRRPIDDALDKNMDKRTLAIDEDAVYAALGYRPAGSGTHGTHVMDIAAGNGQSVFGGEGVAPEADIIFVQLPSQAIEEGGLAFSTWLQHGVAYVFNRAWALGKPAVVNISYGGYTGPHDGTSDLEKYFDQRLVASTPANLDRAIVISAGNGFGARCHAEGAVEPGAHAALDWQIAPYDPSLNLVDIWCKGEQKVAVTLVTPFGQRLGPVLANDPRFDIETTPSGEIVGYVDHAVETGNGDNHITISLHPTLVDDGSGLPPCPSGTWSIEIASPASGKAAEFHAWIERDVDTRGPKGRRRQSRFAPQHANARSTVTGIATGEWPIAVGGYDSATDEMAEYSACGPARVAAGVVRPKPEICAPVATDARGRGVSSATSLGSLPTRMGGTSAAAPHVAGLVALMLQLNRDLGKAKLSSAKIRDVLRQGALAGAALPNARPLLPNRHLAADARQRQKQDDADIKPHLQGAGRLHAEETLKRV